jgi:serine/threonine protein kinase
MAETSTPRAFGTYLVERELGRGGMGVVYAARDEVLGKRVAIKVLLDDVSRDSELVERFMNEARAASAIEHPGIVAVHHTGSDGGAVYIVMELLQGESLATRLKARGAMPLALAIGLARQVANALEAAHQAGIVHRDLKPDNVFLVPDVEVAGGERAKLLDFGVAKLLGDGAATVARTMTGAILGTPHYMSPEQCEGAREVDARSDLYSLGCMLFQMVSGRLPFQSAGVGGLIGMHLHVAPPTLRSVRPDAPVELETLIARLLAKDPAERLQTAAEVAGALAQIPTSAVRTSTPSLPPPIVDPQGPTMVTSSDPTPVRARRWTWPVLAAIAIVAIAIVLVWSQRGQGEVSSVTSVAESPQPEPRPSPPPPPAPVVEPVNPMKSELEVGQRKLADNDFDGAIAQATFILGEAPGHAGARELETAARRGKAEQVLARMRTQLTAKRYADVRSGRDQVLAAIEEPAVRAKAERMWGEARALWIRDAQVQAKQLFDKLRCAELETLAKQVRDILDLSGPARSCPARAIERAANETDLEARKIKDAKLRMNHHLPQMIVSGCIDLVRLDPGQVLWDSCVRAQCEINPNGVYTLLLSAPINNRPGLVSLCPALRRKD